MHFYVSAAIPSSYVRRVDSSCHGVSLISQNTLSPGRDKNMEQGQESKHTPDRL